MTVISNTTPIISLASIGRIDILQNLFDTITIPEAVYNELKAKKSWGYSEVELPFIKIQKVPNRNKIEYLLKDMDIGEAECIILAKELKSDILIMDEDYGYHFARNEGIFTIRTLTVLKLAKEKKIISQIKPLLDDMLANGRWYSKNTYQQFLKMVGEL